MSDNEIDWLAGCFLFGLFIGVIGVLCGIWGYHHVVIV